MSGTASDCALNRRGRNLVQPRPCRPGGAALSPVASHLQGSLARTVLRVLGVRGVCGVRAVPRATLDPLSPPGPLRHGVAGFVRRCGGPLWLRVAHPDRDPFCSGHGRSRQGAGRGPSESHRPAARSGPRPALAATTRLPLPLAVPSPGRGRLGGDIRTSLRHPRPLPLRKQPQYQLSQYGHSFQLACWADCSKRYAVRAGLSQRGARTCTTHPFPFRPPPSTPPTRFAAPPGMAVPDEKHRGRQQRKHFIPLPLPAAAPRHATRGSRAAAAAAIPFYLRICGAVSRWAR